MRIDKLLANMGKGSRKDVKALIKKKKVIVNGKIIKDSGSQVNENKDKIEVNGDEVIYQQFIYLMMNKKAGFVSATTDDKDMTVIDQLKDDVRHFDVFPVGRLDKDTEGLLLLTNDGVLAHELLSPKKKVGKTYYAKIIGNVGQADVEAFEKGVTLDDGYVTKPGQLNILASGDESEIELTIMEGKFHQVKRMFEAVGKKVSYLKRLSMGGLQLDESLPLGGYRELRQEELEHLKGKGGLSSGTAD